MDATALLVPEGSTGTVTIRLAEQPAGPVTVQATFLGGAGVFSVDPSSVAFDPTDWDQPRTMTVSAASDPDALHNWARLQLSLDGGADVVLVNVTQEDEDAPVSTDGVQLKVKDPSGVGATEFPVTAVIPLERGLYADTAGFRVVDASGDPVPAQFEVLNRWWATDNSIRHVVTYFQATVPPDGEALYTFEASGGNVPPADPVQVTETGGTVTVDTGVLRFTVKRDGFNLFDEVWLDSDGDGSYSATEKIVASDADNGPVFTGRLAGDVQRPGSRSDLRLTVEESGPMRAVIRVSGLTLYESTTDHTHGFAARIQAFAGKSFVKVDYQLQNSAKNKRHAWALYFEDVSLQLTPDLTSPTLRLATGPGNTWSGDVGNGYYVGQDSLTASSVHRSDNGALVMGGSNAQDTPSFGWADLSDGSRGVMVAIKNLAEMWPGGVEVTPGGEMSVRLWPRWSAQFHNAQISSTGLYWLEDMQHVLREVYFYFHPGNPSSAVLDDLARNFQRHPIPFVPTSEYYRTRVTLDLDGILPTPEPKPGTDDKKVHVKFDTWYDPSLSVYAFGWRAFGGDAVRHRSSNGGGFPRGGAIPIATERIDDWLTAESYIWEDLNCRAGWMPDYTYADDYDFLELSTGFDARTLRAKDGDKLIQLEGAKTYMDAPYLPGTGILWSPRDNEHAWLYNNEEFYYISANPWIRDFYEFQKEFRQQERAQDITYNGTWEVAGVMESLRGEAHSWGAALQAYRVTGDPVLLDYMRTRLRTSVRPNINRLYGLHESGMGRQSAFHCGMFCRVLAGIMNEIGETDPQFRAELFNVIWGMMEWNLHIGYFGHGVETLAVTPGTQESGVSGGPLVDPQAWFGFQTGRVEFHDQTRDYLQGGLNGGAGPAGDMDADDWQGGWMGRLGELVLAGAPLPPRPDAITDLTARTAGSDVEIEWTTPSGARHFHVLWSAEPISGTYTPDPAKRNAWACEPYGNSLVGADGQTRTLRMTGLPSGATVHVVVYSFGPGQQGMSEISNQVTITVP